ncbi:hypothetical protein D3C78_1469780 [compost metagenome]
MRVLQQVQQREGKQDNRHHGRQHHRFASQLIAEDTGGQNGQSEADVGQHRGHQCLLEGGVQRGLQIGGHDDQKSVTGGGPAHHAANAQGNGFCYATQFYRRWLRRRATGLLRLGKGWRFLQFQPQPQCHRAHRQCQQEGNAPAPVVQLFRRQ